MCDVESDLYLAFAWCLFGSGLFRVWNRKFFSNSKLYLLQRTLFPSFKPKKTGNLFILIVSRKFTWLYQLTYIRSWLDKCTFYQNHTSFDVCKRDSNPRKNVEDNKKTRDHKTSYLYLCTSCLFAYYAF